MGINPECQERWEGSLCTWKIQEHRWGPRPNKSRKLAEHQHPSLSGSWQWGASHRGRLPCRALRQSANQPSSLAALVTYGILFQQWEKSLINYLFHQMSHIYQYRLFVVWISNFSFLRFYIDKTNKDTIFAATACVHLLLFVCVWCMHCMLVCMWGCVCTRVSVHVETHSWHQASSLVAVYLIHWLRPQSSLMWPVLLASLLPSLSSKLWNDRKAPKSMWVLGFELWS